MKTVEMMFVNCRRLNHSVKSTKELKSVSKFEGKVQYIFPRKYQILRQQTRVKGNVIFGDHLFKKE